MSLHTDIKERLTKALSEKDKTRLTTLRGIIAACTNDAVKEGKKPDTELSDEEVQNVISRQVKQHKDSIEQYSKAGRDDLAEEEKAELEILESFLPEQLSENDIRVIVQRIIKSQGYTDMSAFGSLMKDVMQECKGSVDGAAVKAIAEEELTEN